MNTTKKKTTDEDIIDLYFSRDERAIELTDEKYGRYLYTIGYNILRDSGASEESLNDTYFKTWNRIPPERPSIFQAFLSKLMRDVAITRYRKTHAAKRVPSELLLSLEELDDCIPSYADPERDLLARQIAEVLNTLLHELSRRGRFIFVCRYYYCDSVQNIAAMLGVSSKTVYRELEDSRAALREKLLKEGIEI